MNNLCDIFIRNFTLPENRQGFMRCGLAMSTIDAWKLHGQTHIIGGTDFPDEVENFHWKARSFAEEKSQTDLYIFSDNDILPLGENWINRAIAAAERNPDYAILVANQVNHSARIKPQGYEVQPRETCGSPALVRKGMIDWSKLPGPGREEDAIVGKYCKENELKIGTMVEIDVNHIGQGFSVMNPDYWLKY